ncbi:hypothetical protein CALVIDRAFT_234433 [Calocera viscosa TUFC12733]|uniref:Myb-like domain-containing protein n=1 Tax=Calocera viscosa (strain TUFC12733) TaxID=1330018 RepID=A0A167JZS0_CALVF|nr:hypothetical protein CALVIDRAFT_234433 [Calocera viscosa TUFC12733]
MEPNDLRRFESVWAHRAQQEIRKLAHKPPRLEDAISLMRTGLLKDIIEGIVPVLGDYAPTSATPFPSPMKSAAISPVKPKTVRAGFAWNLAQSDAIRLQESASFVEPEEEAEDEAPAKGKRGKGKKARKGKGKGRAKKTNGTARTGSTTGTEAETESEQEDEMAVAAAIAPTVPTIAETSDETLPDIDDIILETQLMQPPAPAAPPVTPKGKKRAREESASPTPRAAKKQARASPVKPSTAGPSTTQLPTPRQFFEDTQVPTPAAKQTPKQPPAEKPMADDTHTEADKVVEINDDEDEVPEEEVEQEEDEEDQLRSSVPLPTPEKPKPPRPAAGPSKAPAAPPTPPPKKEKKPKRDLSSSPAKSAINKKNRYATGGNELGRRQWSTVEDNALMSALEDIHDQGAMSMKWKTVLLWHGPDGSKSTILKDRNNAQLKDRARNLFLKYQRNGQEPPVWLPDK